MDRGCVLAAQLRRAWSLSDFCVLESPYRKRTLFLVGNVDSRDLHRVGRKCAGTGGRCSVSGLNMFIQRLPHHILHVTTPALTVCLSRLP